MIVRAGFSAFSNLRVTVVDDVIHIISICNFA